MPKVALVYPYYRTYSATEMLFAPLGESLLKGQLCTLGIDCRIFDCTFTRPRDVYRFLADWRPDIVGIYSMVSVTRSTFRIAEAARELLPACILVAGGALPTLYPRRFLRFFDVVFRGEADQAFPRFCRDAFARGLTRGGLSELPLGEYAGLFADDGTVHVDNPAAHHAEEELAGFALPDRSGFDHAAYQEAWRRLDGSRTASLITTLGCPYDCDFCSKPIFGSVFRRRRLDAVLADVDQVQALGYDSLWIADDSLTLNLPHLAAFCGSMADRGMRWSCLSRVTGLDAVTARTMREAGCRRVYLGLESGSLETLRLMNKRATVEDGREAVRLYRDAGIEVAAFFMVGYPGETLASVETTFRLALSLPLDDISFNVPFPLPGSRLFDRVSGLDEEMDWDAENEITFVYESEFDQQWLSRRIAATTREFARVRAARSGTGRPARMVTRLAAVEQ